MAWLAPAASVLAFVLIVFFRLFSSKLGSAISIVAAISGLLVFGYVFSQFDKTGAGEFSNEWFTVGSTVITVGINVDQLSVVMLGIVTFVALLVHDSILN